ncbi:DeoR family transcriptional regulator [Pandoraea sp. CB10b_02]|uniref:DeoR family transcriptional regulator n=1 Tax=Pandoraea sp. CB10b_02 TaxID=2014535 RepID=UPI00257E76DB|nr:DeoR family transcriptional regulator [Pandoraea sp. CB10b_02]
MTEIATDPIFRSVEQALHVSFLMETLPVTQKSQMQVMIDRMMEDMGIVQEREKGTINFGGLTALEIRGQCAMVRGAVIHHLPKPEADAVHARFGYQVCKAGGVRGVRDYCSPMLSTQGDMATLTMAWGVFGTQRQRDDLSVRKIAAEYGLSPATVGRDMQIIRNTGRLLLNRGVERLAPMFEAQNLVGDF